LSFSNDPESVQSQLPISIEMPDDPAEYRNKMTDLYQKIASSLNGKEGGLYLPQEKTTGQQYFDSDNPQVNKNVYRMVVDFGSLPDIGTKNVAHNIQGWNQQYRLT
jgi:hypothetical protein